MNGRKLGDPIRIECWVCHGEVTGTLTGDGGYGDDGTQFRWQIDDRKGCDCLDDSEVLEVWENQR